MKLWHKLTLVSIIVFLIGVYLGVEVERIIREAVVEDMIRVEREKGLR